MRTDLTDIILVVDRSGSMEDCKLEAQTGINAFIEDQKKKDGEAVFTLLQFDTEREYVFNATPIKQVHGYELKPRGMTALLDAVGTAIKNAGERFEKMNEKDRPGLVVMAIITDGLENASSEFKKDSIKKMIEHQQAVYNWQFTFLGANQDAFAEAHSMGINIQGAANYVVSKSFTAYSNLSSNVGRMREATSAGRKVENSYTDEERESM